jgi:hypothetical protein
MLDYAYNWQLLKENTLTFPKLQRYYLWTDTTGETKMKFQTGNAPDFGGAVFQILLIWLWMRKDWACALCLFPKVSAALWRICRHIIGRLTIRDYIYQVSAWCPYCVISNCMHFSMWFRGETKLPQIIYHRIDMWKTHWGLILNNVCHVSVDIMELIWRKKLAL